MKMISKSDTGLRVLSGEEVALVAGGEEEIVCTAEYRYANSADNYGSGGGFEYSGSYGGGMASGDGGYGYMGQYDTADQISYGAGCALGLASMAITDGLAGFLVGGATAVACTIFVDSVIGVEPHLEYEPVLNDPSYEVLTYTTYG